MTEGMRRVISVPIFALLTVGAWEALQAGETPVAQSEREPMLLPGKAAGRLLAVPVRPDYPVVARMNFIEGKVRLRILVSAQGTVRRAHVLEGFPLLAVAVLKAVRQWIYRPFSTGAGPAEFLTDVEVRFRLTDVGPQGIPPDAESFFSRQVRPPEVLERPSVSPPGCSVRLRVLVNEAGRAVDAGFVSGHAAAYPKAWQIVEGWRFRPARWGTVAIPAYVEVDASGKDSLVYAQGRETGD